MNTIHQLAANARAAGMTMGTQAHARIFAGICPVNRCNDDADRSPCACDIVALIDETINPQDYLQDLTPRGMAALAAVEI